MDSLYMDVIRKKTFNKKVVPFLLTFVIILIYLYFNSSSSNGKTINKKSLQNLVFDTVQRGDLSIKVNVYGELNSANQTLINAQTKASIDHILLRPGTHVEEGSVIMKLSSPELEEKYDLAKNSFEVEVANKRYLLLQQERELLDESLKLKKLLSKQRTASFKSREIAKLAKDGVISKLDYLKITTEASEINASIEIVQKGIRQLEKMHSEGRSIQDAKINRHQNQLKSLEQKISLLTVKANMDGIVQSLFVELGQSVQTGDKLVAVSDNSNLVAIIKIAQSQAGSISLGQEASINISGEIVIGKLIRIEPIVKEGTVTAEVSFDNSLPVTARPSLAVDGVILIDEIQDTLYVRRSVSALPHSRIKSLVKLEQQSEVKEVDLLYGAANQNYIQIKQGAILGTHVAISSLNE